MRWRRVTDKREDSGSSADEAWASGWRMSSGGVAVAVSLARWGLWGLVVAGPLVGLLAWSSASGSESTAAPRVVAKSEPVVDTAGPGGFAELFVTTFLSVSADQSQRLDAFLPGASARLSGGVEPVAVERAAAVRVQSQSRSYWAVTVAVQVAPISDGDAKEEEAKGGQEQDVAGGLRFFRVPVAAVSGAEGFVAVSLPSEVGAPESGEGRGLGYGRPGPAQKSDPAAGTVQGFFESYLTGRGEVERFLAPKTSVPALRAAPYEQVRIVEWAVRGADLSEAPEEAAPADGERREVVVEVEAAEQAGQWRPMTYALVLAARDGRWEVAELSDAPRLASGGGEK